MGAAGGVSRRCTGPRRGGCGTARDHERAHGPATKRRGGLHRARHLPLDACVVIERRARADRAGAGGGASAPGRAARSPGRNRLAHRPCPPAPLPDGRSARVPRDDARGRRHRAAAAVDLVRDERHDARRSRRSTDPELLHTQGEAPRPCGLHRRRERACDERAVDGLRADAAHRRHARTRRRRERADLRVGRARRPDTSRIRPPLPRSRPRRRSHAGASSTRDRSARSPPGYARRSPRAQPSTGASREIARHSCRTSRCWRSSRSDSCSTVAISESG